MSEHIVPTRIYVAIFAVLLLMTALTVWVAFIDLGPFSSLVAMGIASFKATLVVLYFMHVRYGTRLVALVVAGGFAWLAVLIGLTLSDYGSRGWLPFPGK